MRDLVRDDVGERLVPGEEGGRGEGEARVLHAAVGEAGREDEDVVDAPDVGAAKVLGGLQHGLRVLELLGGRIHELRL